MIGTIFLVGALAISLKVSPLLANMMLRVVVSNFVARREDLFAAVESIEEPIFGTFFTLAGAHFDFRVFGAAVIINELLTPFSVRFALFRAGEAKHT